MPPNTNPDSFSLPVSMRSTESGQFTDTTVGLSWESGEPPSLQTGGSVAYTAWYAWTCPTPWSGGANFAMTTDLSGTGIVTSLEMFSGTSLGSLVSLTGVTTMAGQECPSPAVSGRPARSCIIVPAASLTAGVIYYVRVASDTAGAFEAAWFRQPGTRGLYTVPCSCDPLLVDGCAACAYQSSL